MTTTHQTFQQDNREKVSYVRARHCERERGVKCGMELCTERNPHMRQIKMMAGGISNDMKIKMISSHISLFYV